MIRFFCVLAVATALHAQEEMIIESGLAAYDGKKIVLSKEVSIDHEIGKITANKVILTPAEEEKKKFQFSFLEMQDNVHVSMQEGGVLNCNRAELDHPKLLGKFYGDVTYNEECVTKGNVRVPLSVKAQQMTLLLTKEDDKIQVNSIEANQDILIHYNLDFAARADQAVYQRLTVENQGRIIGEVALRKKERGGVCQVINKQKDCVDADEIKIDTIKRVLYCTFPKGSFLFDSQHHATQQERVDFSSDHLIWDDRRDQLTMRDHVSINQAGIGLLRSDREVQVFHYKSDGKRKVKTIESSGETILEYIDPDKNLTHLLIAYGKVTVDHEHGRSIIESPRDIYGLVPEGQQVFFSDRFGEVYADKVVLEYEEINHTLSPAKLVLEGNIRLMNRSSVNQDETEAFLQYALADKVIFFPKTHEMKMTAENPTRVLFFDKVNNLQISAPTVTIKRDQEMKKESVKGEGDVRFSFVDKELEKLKKHFALEALYKGKE